MPYPTTQSSCRIRRRAGLATAARHVIERLETRVLLSAGQPDPTFGTNGVVTTSFGTGREDGRVQGMALQPDGKIVVVGDAGPLIPIINPAHDFALVRYTPAGALDNSFGQGGIVIVPGEMNGRNVALQPDGKILIAAYVGSPAESALLRYTATGMPDSSFEVDGKSPTDIWQPTIAVRPDGRIILAGSNTSNSVACTELDSYLPGGQPDPSFGTAGRVFISSGPAAGGATAMTLQPDGKIDFVGTYDTRDAGTDVLHSYLTRLNANGTTDSSFGTSGTVVTGVTGNENYAMALTCESGGDIIVAGYATVGSKQDAAMAFYTSSGALDLSRGSAGKVTTSFDSSPYASASAVAIAVQPADGKIVLADNVRLFSDGFKWAWGLARYTPAGNLDPTFGTGGISVSMSVGYTGYNGTYISGMALQDDGKIVLAGTPFSGGVQVYQGDFAVARYLGDGGPLVSTPFFGQPVSVPAAAIEAKNFDNGGEGVAYHDTTRQNIGGAYRNSFVDVLPLIGTSNGYAVGYTDVGEWLKYTINVTAAGTYTLQSRVASDLPGGTFHIELDGTNVTGTLKVPHTGGWNIWQTLTSRPFTISLGRHVMRLVEDTTGTLGAVANFDTFSFAALPGLPDPSFGINGVVSTTLGTGREAASVGGMALQPDGKILVTGAFYENRPATWTTDATLVRYTPSGALDNSFGKGGVVFVPGGKYGNAIAVQPDGKILVAAYIDNANTIALFRYTASGLPDSSFGVGGEVGTDFWVVNIALRPDGRIVLAGRVIVNNANCTELASYLPNGHPDPSFGNGGTVLITTGPDSGGATALTLQPDGKIDFVGTYVTGTYAAGTYNEDWYLARLNANGTADSSFGTGGTVVTDFGGPDDGATALTCEPGGDIIVAGYATVDGPTLAFYTSSGVLDLSRGTAGKVFTSSGAIAAIAIQPADGKIVLAGEFSNGVSGTEFWSLARYTPAGSLDPTFGTGGISLSNGIDFMPADPFRGTLVAGMALQDDGKFVLIGYPYSGHVLSQGELVVARYLGDGGPRVSTPFSGQPISVPAGIIEAKNFDNGGEGVAYHDTTPQNLGGAYRNSFVDLKALPGASNGYAVGYTDSGEWLKYTINVTTAGTYTLQSRVASFLTGGTFHVEVDGTNVTGAINVPDTGGWSNWQTLTSRPFILSAGTHVMRLVEERTGTLGAVGNFDTFRFVTKPVTAGAGRVGLWDPATKTFYLDSNNNGVFDSVGDTTVTWANATSTMLAVTGDWSGGGHGKYTGLFDRSTAAWYLDMNENNVALDTGDVVYARYGNTGDLPVVGDWTGNGKTRIGVWRPSQNSFTLDLNGDGTWQSGTDRWFQISPPFNPSDTYTPVAGDWNGDGKTQLGFFDATTHTWYLDQNQVTDATHLFSKLTFGNSWDQPLVGRWNTAYALSQIGTWRPGDSTIRLDFNVDWIFDTGDRSYPGWGLAKNDLPVAI